MCLGIPGQVIDLGEVDGVGNVGRSLRKQACLEYVPGVRLGEYVIVHVGFAISRVDEEEAKRTLDVLRAMGDAVAAELGEPLPTPTSTPADLADR